MKQTQLLMGMPITIEIGDKDVAKDIFDKTFAYFASIDKTFSTYKKKSEIMKINRGELGEEAWSRDMKTVFALAQQAKKQTQGYFDIGQKGAYDPSGIVKGWAIYNAAQQLLARGYVNFYIDAGGDIQTYGKNAKGEPWHIGIRNPFNQKEIVKVLYLSNKGIATSGTYERGEHIYNPKKKKEKLTELVSLTIIGPDVYQADVMATAAFAMGKKGISFIERLSGYEGYMIEKNSMATYTSGFSQYAQTV